MSVKIKKVKIEVKESLSKIFEQIDNENCYACDQWGYDFDDHNTINDWISYMTIYMGRAVNLKASKEEQRKNLKKVANLAVSAIESFDRNNGFPKRHYD
jgi:hypothetical protein